MQLTITVEATGEIITVDIPESLILDDFKAYLQSETGIDPAQQVLKHNNKSLHENKLLSELNIKDNDLIVVGLLRNVASSSPAVPNHLDTQFEMARQQLLSNSNLLQQIKVTNPDIESIVHDPARFKQLMLDMQNQHNSASVAQQEELKKLEQNPDDPQAQARILELIRQEQIDENYKLAYDITPESFATVTMLYIDLWVNGHKVQAFVDSGAQSTIISPRLAEKCGIDRLIDKRFIGEARGVGSQKIEGKIHSTPIKIGNSNIEIPCSFMVLDTLVDLLFGLDMLRRHKCVIDLVNNQLAVGDDVITKFLAESEIENNPFSGASNGPNNGGQSLGGNIFSEPIKPATQKPPTNAAAEAAVKRQNLGTSSSSSAQIPSNSSSYKPTESQIKQLIDLGFSKDEAIKALILTNGNVDMAASLLFQ